MKILKKLPRTLSILLTLLTFSIPYFYPPLVSNVGAAKSTSLTSVADSFVRENFPNNNYGSWNDMTIGKSWNLGNYFSNSFAYVKFNVGNIPSQSIIESATLEMYQYVRSSNASGNYTVNVAKANANWSELGITWNNKPSFSGIYARGQVDGFSGQFFSPPKKFTFDVTDLVQSWVRGTPNNGFVLYKDSGNAGGFWCSRNYNDSTCFVSSQPRLKITYAQNTSPYIPNPTSPNNLAEFGGDSSEQGMSVTMKVNGLGDSEGNLDGTWFYYKNQRDSEWITLGKRTGKKTAQYSKHFSDGIWEWRARSRDSMGLWSNYSPIMTFIVDTTPPRQSNVNSEPSYSPGTQNTVSASESNDELVGEVQYMFNILEGVDCSKQLTRSSWQYSQEFTIGELVHNEQYCYQVKTKDKLGNETSWSEVESSIQDAVFPKAMGMSLNNDVFSPNEDGVFDEVVFSFEIVEEHFDRWEVTIVNSTGDSIVQFNGVAIEESVVWDGKDASNMVVPDGPYTFTLSAYDKAGNKTVDNSQTVIVDNEPATLHISQPVDEDWFNSEGVTIAGITELGVQLTVNGKQYTVDESGLFEGVEHLNTGENSFEIVAIDLVSNRTTQVIVVHKENIAPEIKFIQPDLLIKDEKLKIKAHLIDETSGVEVESVFLSITDSDGKELVLVNEGQNVQMSIGHIETDCLSDVTGGSQSCNYSYVFDEPLQPDGSYMIKTNVADVAGNRSQSHTQEFILDSHTYLQVDNPIEGKLFNKSKISITGSAERGGQLIVKQSNSEPLIVQIDPVDENVTDCELVDESFGVGWQGVREVCDFSISDFELEVDSENDVDIVNTIDFTLTDTVGNDVNIQRSVKVNLFAVELSIEGNLEFISPNGDGRQDGIDFTMSALNRENDENDVDVLEWEIHIKNANGQMVKRVNGRDSLPPNYYFDGKNNDDVWLADGDYSYTLWLKTTDGVEFRTLLQTFYVETKVDGEVVITTPKNNFVTTRGVVNVQGQAPVGTMVKLCVDAIGIDGDCNDEQVLGVDDNGFFTGIVPLSTKESYLWGVAYDQAGNHSGSSNRVKVILDFSDPLIGAYALPSLTGINQEVVFRSIVSENTQSVRMKFSDYSNLSELPDGDISWYLIGDVDDVEDTDLDDPCDISQCTWDYAWTTPEVNGGVYEIKFTAKKGEVYQSSSLGLRIDGTIPVVPTILKLTKQVGTDELRLFNNNYYTNTEDIVVAGVAEPLSHVHVLLDDNEITNVKSDVVGKWKANVKLPVSDYEQFELTSVSSDNVHNFSETSFPISIILDKVHPKFERLSSSNTYYQSGAVADVLVVADENLYSAEITRKDHSTFTMSSGDTYQEFMGSFEIESDAHEGPYLAHIEIEDLAGNISSESITFIIDNTPPETTSLDTSNWGKFNGVGSKIDVPAKGRLVPEYVTRGNELSIAGRAERFGIVEIWLSSQKIDQVMVSEECNESLCDWKYNLALGGIERGYIIQTKVVDQAGNKSTISERVLLFYDKTAPKQPRENDSDDYWDEDGKGRVTNKANVTLVGGAEKLSDVEVWLNGPNGYKNYYIGQTSSKGIWGTRVRLGKIEGKKEDGNYQVTIKSTDAAGNASKTFRFSIERDSISPATPTVSDPYLCGSSICMKVNGEDGASIFANGQLIGRARSGGVYTITSQWTYDKSYSYNIFLQDRARNRSTTVTKTFSTPSIPLGDADVKGVSATDPWGDQKGNEISEVKMSISIKPDGSYRIDNISVPEPILTKAITRSDDIVEVYGVGIPKYHALRVDITREYMTYYEAVSYCNVGVLLSGEDKSCIAKWMGYDNYTEWSKYLIGKCFINPACNEYEKRSKRRIGRMSDQGFEVEHVQVKFVNFTKGGKLIGELWNDSKDGRFMKKYKLGKEVNLGEHVKANVTIFGDFNIDGIRVDYRGKTREVAKQNKGLSSGWSNDVRVERSQIKKLDGLDYVVLDVPYINQYIEPNGAKYPSTGWKMCGAASAVMITGYHKALVFDDSNHHSLKRYVYSDSGQGIPHVKCGGGAFELTSNHQCFGSIAYKIQEYLARFQIRSEYRGFNEISLQEIQQSINSGNPVILSLYDSHDGGFPGHIVTIIGYIRKTNKIIIHDSYTDLAKYGRGWREYDSGMWSVHEFNSNRWPPRWYIKVL